MHPPGARAEARTVRDRAPAPRARRLAAMLAAGALAACSPSEGYIEIAWSFIDQGGSTLYPDGVLPDTCDFTAAFAGESGGNTLRPARLRVELAVCDPTCSGGCDDPECTVVDPAQ
ncbi:MAG: hypothetical protein R3A79_25415, partial [Nannocystaceae bacterium]